MSLEAIMADEIPLLALNRQATAHAEVPVSQLISKTPPGQRIDLCIESLNCFSISNWDIKLSDATIKDELFWAIEKLNNDFSLNFKIPNSKLLHEIEIPFLIPEDPDHGGVTPLRIHVKKAIEVTLNCHLNTSTTRKRVNYCDPTRIESCAALVALARLASDRTSEELQNKCAHHSNQLKSKHLLQKLRTAFDQAVFYLSIPGALLLSILVIPNIHYAVAAAITGALIWIATALACEFSGKDLMKIRPKAHVGFSIDKARELMTPLRDGLNNEQPPAPVLNHKKSHFPRLACLKIRNK